MDADEALARMLQEEELRAAGALPGAAGGGAGRVGGAGAGGGDSGTDAFQNRLRIMMETALRCEDKGLQERARAVMPLAQLLAAADEAAELVARLGPDVAAPAREDLLARGLLQWFKQDFFKWVDTLPCERCGNPATQASGGAQPLPEDLAAGAHRVELHRCGACGGATRFPRYNDPGKLLQPSCRRGRCGEWANAFLLCCRAAGLTARYVSDWSDHVWTEYYSHAMRRWVHLDSCEASYDQPLLYESGWGKPVSYVVSVGAWGATDVTARYTDRWRREVVHRRTLVPERWLARRLDEMTVARRAAWPAPRRMAWLGRDAEERVELLRRRLGLAAGARPSQPLPGRQTGSLDWRQQRGETGLSSQPAAASAPTARPPTSYRLAPDGPGQLPPVFLEAGRLSGGACRASGHNETAEVVERLFDGRTSTKWLDFGGGGVGGSSWVEYRLPADMPAVVVDGYELVSANDCPERDPAEWRLEAVTEADFAAGDVDKWTSLDRQTSVRFPARHAPLAFHLPHRSPPCRRLRLAIAATADPRAANSVQLACWNLYGKPYCRTEDGTTGGSGKAVASSSSSSSGVLAAPRASGGVNGAGGGSDEAAAPAPLEATTTKDDEEGLSRSRTDEEVMFERLRSEVVAVVAAAGGAAGSVAAGDEGVKPEALALLARLLDNIRRQPQEPKFRKVRCTKVQALLSSPLIKEVLFSYIRFRPLMMPAPAEVGAGSGGEAPAGEDVFLVLAADGSGSDFKRITQIIKILPQQ